MAFGNSCCKKQRLAREFHPYDQAGASGSSRHRRLVAMGVHHLVVAGYWLFPERRRMPRVGGVRGGKGGRSCEDRA